MGRNVEKYIKNTILSDVYGYLYNLFGKEKSRSIIFAIGYKIEELIRVSDYKYNKNLDNICKKEIIPIIALFRYFKENGMIASEAIRLIDDYVYKYLKPEINKLGKFSKSPLYFDIYKIRIKKYKKKKFSKELFNTQLIENTDKNLSIDITSCVYCKILDEFNASELKQTFCQKEKKLFANASKDILVSLDKTIAEGSDRCEFRFIKRK